MTTCIRKYKQKYEDNVELIGIDGYSNYLDGYDEIGFIDGYEIIYDNGERNYFSLYYAWKLRKELDNFNLILSEMHELSSNYKKKNEYRNQAIELCKLIDRSENNEQYERICNKDDIRLRKYPKDSFFKIK